MIGSEHLSSLLRRDRTGGQVIGAGLREALQRPTGNGAPEKEQCLRMPPALRL